jgi:uncharacterized protein YcbK (DUF882 family)
MDELAFDMEVPGRGVAFPGGVTLPATSGLEGKGQTYYDPYRTGNPLLDTAGANRRKRLSRNFTVDELAKSGSKRFTKARIDPKLVACLQAIRNRIGRAVTVLSGYRSYSYNAEVYRRRGQTPINSRHSSGQAADIKVSGMSGMDLAKAAIDACGGEIAVGIGGSSLHIDVRGRWARWTYLKPGSASQAAIREIDAYRQRRGSRPRPVAPSPATPSPPAAPASGLRGRIAALARQEWERWGRGQRKETNPAMRDILKDYWRKTGQSSQSADIAIQKRYPWSAAFISWVMHEAGAGSAFRYSSAHRVYIAAAKRNRQSGDAGNPFWTYRIDEVAPQVGDLVCADRAACSGCPCSGANYGNIDNGELWPTHCDIVTEVDRSRNRIRIIGGNVSDSVTAKEIGIDDRGFVIANQKGCPFFAIIKVRG